MTQLPDHDPYAQHAPGDHKPQPRGGLGLFVAFFVLLSLAVPAYFLYPVARDLFAQDRLRKTGVSAPAQVLAVVETDTTINNQRVYELTLLIAPNVGEPYEVQVSQALSPLATAGIAMGSHVEVKYDPKQPRAVVVTKTGLTAPAPKAGQPKPASGSSDQNAKPLDRSVCLDATRCCLVVAGPSATAACETFTRMEQIPLSACAETLAAYERTAAQLGRSCEKSTQKSK